MWIINPAVGCHYFPPGLQLPPQPLRGLLPICCLVNRRTMGVNSLPKTVTRQRRDCDLNTGPSAPESSMLTHSSTEPPGTTWFTWTKSRDAASNALQNNTSLCRSTQWNSSSNSTPKVAKSHFKRQSIEVAKCTTCRQHYNNNVCLCFLYSERIR